MARRARKPARPLLPDLDTGPRERHQHGDLIIIADGPETGEKVARVTSQTMLDRYLIRGQLADPQPEAGSSSGDATATRRFQAAHRLYGDWYACGLEPSVIANYGERLDRSVTPGDPAAHHYIAFRRALQAVGLQLSPILVHVVLLDKPASQWAASHRYAAQAAMPILHLALDALATHYGMS